MSCIQQNKRKRGLSTYFPLGLLYYYSMGMTSHLFCGAAAARAQFQINFFIDRSCRSAIDN